MHELFGNTADINAGSTQTPFGALGRWLHEIEDCDFGTKLGRLLGASKSSRTATDDYEVVFVFLSIYNKSSSNDFNIIHH
jgi:hypothetical protein